MEISEDLKSARDIIQAFLKSKKILRMYPQNNPIYVKTLEDSYSRFKSFFHYKDVLNLKIKQNEIFYDADQVYQNPDKEDNIALFFFKDGLREITFKAGLGMEEMEEFLKIISLDFDRDVVDDDIVTLFWERDFQNIQYIVDETFLSDEEDYEARAMEEMEEKRTDPDNIHKAYEDAFNQADEVKDLSIIQLSDKELNLLFKVLEEDAQDKSEKLSDILFEMIHLSESKEEIADLSGFFMNSVEFSVRNGNIRRASDVLSRIRQLINNADLNTAVKQQLRRIMLFAGSEKIINYIGEILDSGQEIDEKLLEDYVTFIDKNSIMPFVKILGELKTIHARKIVIDALVYLGPKDIVMLTKGLNDSRWYVVRNIIYILRKIGDKRAVEYLLKTVRHGDIRVKKEVIRTLGELGGSNVLLSLRDCLNDPEDQVRIAALKALGNIGSEACKRMIMDGIQEKKFKDKEFSEKKEYFEVLAGWRDKEVLVFLLKIMKKRSFFGRSKLFEEKACAAYGLGLIGNSDAIPMLNKFRGSSNKLLREYSLIAIKRIGHGK
jgi:hypothetical protein